MPIDDDLALVLRGRPLRAADRRVLEAFAAQAAVALRQQRLAAEAEQAHALDQADRMRAALLAAGRPRATHTARIRVRGVDSLRSPEINWSRAPNGPSWSPPRRSRSTGTAGSSRTCST